MVHIRLVISGQDPRLEVDNGNEEEAVDDVADIADCVIKVREDTQGPGAAVIMPAPVNVPGVITPDPLGVHELDTGDEVEHGEERHHQQVAIAPYSPMPDALPDHDSHVPEAEVSVLLSFESCHRSLHSSLVRSKLTVL